MRMPSACLRKKEIARRTLIGRHKAQWCLPNCLPPAAKNLGFRATGAVAVTGAVWSLALQKNCRKVVLGKGGAQRRRDGIEHANQSLNALVLVQQRSMVPHGGEAFGQKKAERTDADVDISHTLHGETKGEGSMRLPENPNTHALHAQLHWG